MPTNLGLIQQRCIKKMMEHVDAKTAAKDVEDTGLKYLEQLKMVPQKIGYYRL